MSEKNQVTPPAEPTAEEFSEQVRIRREKLAALTGQFAPEGPEAQGIIDEN